MALRVRVDTRALKNLTASAKELTATATAIRTLGAEIGGVVGKVNSRVRTTADTSGVAVAQLRKEVADLRKEQERLATTDRAPSTGGPSRHVIPGRGPESTRRFLMDQYGISKGFLDAHPMKAKGAMNNPGGGIPTPRQSGNTRYYDNNQLMAAILQAKVTHPIVTKLNELQDTLSRQQTTPTTDSNFERALLDGLSRNVGNLSSATARLTEKVVAMETLARRLADVGAGHRSTPPPRAGGNFVSSSLLSPDEIQSVINLPQRRRITSSRGSGKGRTSGNTIDFVGDTSSTYARADVSRPSIASGTFGASLPEIYDSARKQVAQAFDARNASPEIRNQLAKLEKRLEALYRRRDGTKDPKRYAKYDQYIDTYQRQISERSEPFERQPEALQARYANQAFFHAATKSAISQDLISPKLGKSARGDRTGLAQLMMGNEPTRQMVSHLTGIDYNQQSARDRFNKSSAQMVREMLQQAIGAAPQQQKQATARGAADPLDQVKKLAQQLRAKYSDLQQAGESQEFSKILELSQNTPGAMEHLTKVFSQANSVSRRRTVSAANPSALPNIDPDVFNGGGKARRGPKPPASYSERFRGALERSALWGGAGMALYGGVSQVSQGVGTMADFEQGLTDIRKVLNPIGSEMNKISVAARDMAKELGVGVMSVTEAMTIYAQQGRAQADIISQTRTALLATNVTELDAVEATEALTAAHKQFSLSASNSMRILDAWNEVENTTSVNARVLTEALKNAGTVARLAGVDFDEFNGIAAAMGEATRKSGEAIGTSLKFIIQNARTDEAVESLQEVGILSVSQSGKFKSFGQTINELSKKWDTLSDSQKQNVAVNIAGVRRLNDFFVMMDNWGRAQDIAVVSMTSVGSASRENEIAMTSLRKELSQLKATWDDVWISLGESGALDVLKVLTRTLKSVADAAAGVNKATGGMFGGLAGTVGAAAAVAAPFMWMSPPGTLQTITGMGGQSPNDPQSRYDARRVSGTQRGLASANPALMAARPDGGRMRDLWSAPQYSVSRRRMGALAGLVGTHALSSAYTRPDRPTLGSTAADIGLTGASNLALGAMFTKPVSGGLGAKWSGQSGVGKFAIAALVTTTLSEIYTSVRNYTRSQSATAKNEGDLTDLRNLADRYEGTEAELKSVMDSVASNRSDVDPARLLQLQDMLTAANPGGPGLRDLNGNLEAIRKAQEDVSRNRAGVIAQQLKVALGSEEVRNASSERRRLEGELGRPDLQPQRRFQIQSQLANTTSTFDRNLFGPQRGLLTQLGRDRSGIGEALPILQQVSQATGLELKTVLSSGLRDYIEASTGTVTDIDAMLKDLGMTVEEFYRSGRVQYEKGGQAYDVATGSPSAATSGVARLYDDSKYIVNLSAKRIATFVNEYTTAVKNLIRSNEEILSSQLFVADALTQAADLSGRGVAATGAGAQSISGLLQALDRIAANDVRTFARPRGQEGTGNVPTQFREMIGQVMRAGRSGQTFGLEGLVSGGLQLEDTLDGILSQADKYLDLMANRRLDRAGRQATEEELATDPTESLKDLLTGQGAGDVFSQIERLLGEARTNPDRRQENIQQAREIVSGTLVNDTAEARTYLRDATRSLATQYQQLGRNAAETLGARYGFLARSGQVSGVSDFMERPEVRDVTEGMSRRRDELSTILEQARTRVSQYESQPEEGRNAAFDRNLRDARDRAEELAASFAAVDGSIKSLAQNIELYDVGMQKLSDELERTMANLRGGAAYGLTGTNVQDAGIRGVADEIRRLNERQDLLPEARVALIRQLSDMQRDLERTAQATIDQRDLAKRGLFQSVLTGRLTAQAGLGAGQGATGYIDAVTSEYREMIERVAEAVGPSLEGRPQSEISEFARNFREATSGIESVVRDLALSQDVEFNKSYTLAAPSTRALVDQVREAIRSGMSAEDVFADPYLRSAAQGEPMLQQMLGEALQGDAMLKALATSNDYQANMAESLKNVENLLRERGIDPSSIGAPKFRTGTMAQAGSMAVDKDGKIKANETLAVLHQGEIVLNRQQAEAITKNRFASGTMVQSSGRFRRDPLFHQYVSTFLGEGDFTKPFGDGVDGAAYPWNDRGVVKFHSDINEIHSSHRLLGKDTPYAAKQHGFISLGSLYDPDEPTASKRLFASFAERLEVPKGKKEIEASEAFMMHALQPKLVGRSSGGRPFAKPLDAAGGLPAHQIATALKARARMASNDSVALSRELVKSIWELEQNDGVILRDIHQGNIGYRKGSTTPAFFDFGRANLMTAGPGSFNLPQWDIEKKWLSDPANAAKLQSLIESGWSPVQTGGGFGGRHAQFPDQLTVNTEPTFGDAINRIEIQDQLMRRFGTISDAPRSQRALASGNPLAAHLNAGSDFRQWILGGNTAYNKDVTKLSKKKQAELMLAAKEQVVGRNLLGLDQKQLNELLAVTPAEFGVPSGNADANGEFQRRSFGAYGTNAKMVGSGRITMRRVTYGKGNSPFDLTGRTGSLLGHELQHSLNESWQRGFLGSSVKNAGKIDDTLQRLWASVLLNPKNDKLTAIRGYVATHPSYSYIAEQFSKNPKKFWGSSESWDWIDEILGHAAESDRTGKMMDLRKEINQIAFNSLSEEQSLLHKSKGKYAVSDYNRITKNTKIGVIKALVKSGAVIATDADLPTSLQQLVGGLDVKGKVRQATRQQVSTNLPLKQRQGPVGVIKAAEARNGIPEVTDPDIIAGLDKEIDDALRESDLRMEAEKATYDLAPEQPKANAVAKVVQQRVQQVAQQRKAASAKPQKGSNFPTFGKIGRGIAAGYRGVAGVPGAVGGFFADLFGPEFVQGKAKHPSVPGYNLVLAGNERRSYNTRLGGGIREGYRGIRDSVADNLKYGPSMRERLASMRSSASEFGQNVKANLGRDPQFGKRLRLAGKMAGRFAQDNIAPALGTLGKYARYGLAPAMVAANFGYDQKLANLLGVGGAYGDVFRPSVVSAINLAGYEATGRTGQILGFGLRDRLAGGIAGKLSGGTGRLAGAGNLAGRGVTGLNRLANGALRVGGTALAINESAQLGASIAGGAYAGMHRLGLISDATRRASDYNVSNIKETLGTPLSSLLKGAGGLIQGTYNAATGKGFQSSLLSDMGQNYDLWKQNRDSLYAEFQSMRGTSDSGRLGESLYRWSDFEGARQRVRDMALQAAWGRGQDIKGALRMPLIVADDKQAASVEAVVSKALGKTGEGSDYVSNLTSQRDRAQKLIAEYRKYLGGMRGGEASRGEAEQRLRQMTDFTRAIEERIRRQTTIKDSEERALDVYGNVIRDTDPKLYSQLMGSGVDKQLGRLASIAGVQVSPDAMGRLREAAGNLPGNASLATLLNLTNSGDFTPDAVVRELGRQRMLSDQEGGISRDRFGDFVSRIKQAVSPEKAAAVAQQLAKQTEAERSTLGGEGMKAVENAMKAAGGEVSAFREFAQIRASLKGRYGDYSAQREKALSNAKAAMESLSLPKYGKGADSSEISQLIAKYETIMPDLQGEYGRVREMYDGASGDTARLMELWGRLPAYAKSSFFRGRDGEQPTPERLIGAARGLDSITPLASYFESGGVFEAWLTAATGESANWNGAATAMAEADAIKARLSGRDTRKSLIRTNLRALQGGKASGMVPVGYEGAKGNKEVYAGKMLASLESEVRTFNKDVNQRSRASQAIVSAMTRATITGEINTPDQLWGRLDTMEPGLADAVLEYGSLNDSIAALTKAGGAGPEADRRRAELERRKAELVLRREHPEEFYSRMSQFSKRWAEQQKASSVLGGRSYDLGGAQYDDAGNGRFVRRPNVRHGGGPTVGETLIKTGAAPEWVMPPSMVEAFKTSVSGMQDILSDFRGKLNVGDGMGSDARQFAQAYNMNVGGTVTHQGSVTLELGQGVESVLTQFVEILSAASKGAPIKVGDKVYRPSTGG
jgi:TP901 family phage tail tape measure protein